MPESCGADIGAFAISLAIRSSDTGEMEFREFPLSDSSRMKAELSKFSGRVVPSVGSGSWRLATSIESQTGALIEKHREPVCVWSAIEYLLSPDRSPDLLEAYRFESASSHPISAAFPATSQINACQVPVSLSDLKSNFPLLLVNVKSGTSFYRIDSPSEFERVGGSSIGAATVSGIGQAILGGEKSVIDYAIDSPSPSPFDLLVEDIYGGDCDSIGLPGNVIASCLGKAGNTGFQASAFAKSILDMTTMNTAQLTNLHAQLHGCRMAIVVGAIGDTPENQSVVAECTQRVLNIVGMKNPNGPIRAVFFQKSRFLGCLGALLRREHLLSDLIGPSTVRMNTATMVDYVIDETCTKLRLSPRRDI